MRLSQVLVSRSLGAFRGGKSRGFYRLAAATLVNVVSRNSPSGMEIAVRNSSGSCRALRYGELVAYRSTGARVLKTSTRLIPMPFASAMKRLTMGTSSKLGRAS